MKNIIYLFIFFSIFNLTSEQLFCSNNNDPPQEVQIDLTYTINPVNYEGEDYTAVKVTNKIFLNK